MKLTVSFFVCICLLHVRLIVGCKVDGPLWVVLGRFRHFPPPSPLISFVIRIFEAIEKQEQIANHELKKGVLMRCVRRRHDWHSLHLGCDSHI